MARLQKSGLPERLGSDANFVNDAQEGHEDTPEDMIARYPASFLSILQMIIILNKDLKKGKNPTEVPNF